MKEKTAKVIRMISVPPIMISVLVLTIAFNNPVVFHNRAEIFMSVLLLGILPTLAYLPCFVRNIEEKRSRQRKLAFVFTAVSYSAMLVWTNNIPASNELLLIANTYFISVFILIFFNRSLKIKASGHACSFTGPILLTGSLVGWLWCVPWCIFAAAVCWSSVYLKRHTWGQLAAGAVACVISFSLAFHAMPYPPLSG